MNRPKIVTICGSFKFQNQMMETAAKLELEKHYIVIQCIYGDMNKGFTLEQKELLGKLHYNKIDISDAIYVVNVDGYIGESTKKEIQYALEHGKEVMYLENKNSLNCG